MKVMMYSNAQFRNPFLSGIGTITSAKHTSDLIVVGSTFRLLAQPPGRAAYTGQALRYRVTIYKEKSSIPIGWYDNIKYPINDIAFHPTEPVIAIATGSYDGGYRFAGELIIWNWESNLVNHKIAETPEVFRVAFNDDGMSIQCIVRPWDDDDFDWSDNYFKHGKNNFDMFYEIRLPYTSSLDVGIVEAKAVNGQMTTQKAMTEAEVNSDARFMLNKDPTKIIQSYFAIKDLSLRSPIWDIAILDGDNIGIVHDDTHLEIFNPDGDLVESFKGTGHGVQILKHVTPIIHIINPKKYSPDWSSVDTRLFQLDETLSEKLRCDGRFTFSMSRAGKIVGRRSRSGSIDPLNDLITSCDLASWEEHDFGYYDALNHFIRIDNSPYDFIVQGTPQSSYAYKVISVIEDDFQAKTLWPIIQGNKPDDMGEPYKDVGLLNPMAFLKKDGTIPPHANECYFTYVKDVVGEGILGTGIYYDGLPSHKGFMYRKPLSKDEPIWSHNVTAACSVMKQIPQMSIAIAAFVDGFVVVIRTDTGKIIHKNLFELNHLPNVVFSLDCSKDNVVFGAMTGEILSVSVDKLLKHGLTKIH